MLALSYAASVFTIAGAFFIASQVPGTLWHRQTDTNSTAAVNTLLTTPIAPPSATQAVHVLGGENSIPVPASNESCNAVNVEAELLKLEQEFCVDKRLNELQHRQRLEHQTKPLLPTISYIDFATAFQDNTQHWLNIKSQYSDDKKNQNVMTFGYNKHNWNDSQNSSVFWQLLRDALSHQSYLVRWPELWPKFI